MSGKLDRTNELKVFLSDNDHEEHFRNYLKDGHIALSNNRAERSAKTYVMGRKNFLFHDTVAGAEVSQHDALQHR